METEKPIHSLVLDAGPIIKNAPAVSTLLAQAEQLFTIPAVVAEIRDEVTRARIQTTLLPFLTQRDPRPESVRTVQEFARRTGDLAVLSRTDIQLIALARELECERNGGEWRLRNAPGQKRTNGPPPPKLPAEGEPAAAAVAVAAPEEEGAAAEAKKPAEETAAAEAAESVGAVASALANAQISGEAAPAVEGTSVPEEATVPETTATAEEETTTPAPEAPTQAEEQEDDEEDSDAGGWITPSNIKKKQAKDNNGSASTINEPKTMQAAIITTDFAMQNVILQMNLNLLSPSLQRVKHLKTFILRCHACFLTTKQMDKQFCPRCGKPTLTRVSCSTDANGAFTLHLKKNMQWNNRGERYSIPKAVGGSASGRVNVGGGGKGGGKGGWGQDLILAEDQKEYMRAITEQKRVKQRDLMDEDYLPGILTGERNKGPGGRPKVGAGRNVNSRKR
ncbi:uncharacterized protein K452DRAFT_288682 [Aplosporella prunicola CBS 121167]|uniref:20S-pre-rRNA D-site endonuclease NOB1 n=1 Tax=Aplosporella prunicola CBS 121167 TaxID=1176127 RepID=A0A6A6BB53_9PEZI|nr:uncharacterized protein K452DRAFT_288682 [Aplosporella prunicola CBS 121167]KAF2140593.1 hypothetical protein K452DRAFT_288682 [Aplosporella prunicola CBS 121167]